MFSEQDPGDILSSSVKMRHAAHLRGSTHGGHEDPASSQLGALTGIKKQPVPKDPGFLLALSSW